MNINKGEISLLIMESALDSAKLHAARTKRRLEVAEHEYNEANDAVWRLNAQIEVFRDQYLVSRCV